MVPPSYTPHSWYQGRASTEVNEGCSINDIKYDCRWLEKSKAFDAYCCTDLVTMCPHEIYKKFPQSCKEWHDAHLVFIANKLVMTAGSVPKHPHHMIMEEEFQEQFQRIKDELSTVYPAQDVLVCISSLCTDAESEVFIKKQKNVAEQHEWRNCRRQRHVGERPALEDIPC